MRKAISEIEGIGKEYGYKPTIIIPAVVLRRHCDSLSHLSSGSLEIGVHGYTHTTYKHLNQKEQADQIKKAITIFRKLGLYAEGFRAPYLSKNTHTMRAVQENELLWESNHTIIWNDCISHHSSELSRFMVHAILKLYRPLDAEKNIAIPRLQGKVVSIPITLPDDEILVDRLGIKDPGKIEQIWSEILERNHQRGEILTLQLHPERIEICKRALKDLLRRASSLEHAIWLTSMEEVAKWWKEKVQFKFTFKRVSQRGYCVRWNCTDRATILCLNPHHQ
ncbi:DUF2334 domain-containing protein, partial [Planctomycetota bacterium]